MIYIFGLGNPGEEYTYTRHNAGRLVLAELVKKYDFSDWKSDMKSKALVAKGEIASEKVMLVEPDNFMNNSGTSVVPFVDGPKKLAKIVVIYDDLDLSIGSMKISFNKSSGGHNGLESIIKKVKSQEFVRVRIGVSPATLTGKIKKPKGEAAVLKFLLGEFKEPELKEIKKLSKKIAEALETFVDGGKDKMMSLHNK